jgi:hypothetical protein
MIRALILFAALLATPARAEDYSYHDTTGTDEAGQPWSVTTETFGPHDSINQWQGSDGLPHFQSCHTYGDNTSCGSPQ